MSTKKIRSGVDWSLIRNRALPGEGALRDRILRESRCGSIAVWCPTTRPEQRSDPVLAGLVRPAQALIHAPTYDIDVGRSREGIVPTNSLAAPLTLARVPDYFSIGLMTRSRSRETGPFGTNGSGSPGLRACVPGSPAGSHNHLPGTPRKISGLAEGHADPRERLR
jgi:hypothetical protein